MKPQKFYHLLLLCTLGLPTLKAAQEQSPQTKAMKLIKRAEAAVHETDAEALTKAVRGLLTIDFQETEAPLSLLIALCDALIQQGREDFLTPIRKTIGSILMKKMAAQTYMRFIKKGRYAFPDTKKDALKKLQNLKDITDPYQEPCGDTIQNLNYVIAIVRLLPENSSKVQAGVNILFHVFKAIYEQDGDSIGEVWSFLKRRAKAIYTASLVEQISLVWFLKALVLRGERGSSEAFEGLLRIHEHTNLAGVMAETVSTFLEIALTYYGAADNEEPFVTDKQAYIAFKQVLEATKKSSRFKLGDKWLVKNLAVEGLIVLQHTIPKQHNGVIKGYLHKIKNDEKKKGKKYKTKTEILFAKEKLIIALFEEIKKARAYQSVKQGMSLSQRLAQENDKQKHLLSEALKVLEEMEELLKQRKEHLA